MPLATAIHEREQAGARRRCPTNLRTLPVDQVELKPTNMVGIDALSSLFTTSHRSPQRTPRLATASTCRMRRCPHWSTSSPTHDHGLIMCMGKGGVGKTTIAAAIAVALAEPRPPGAPDHHRPRRTPRPTPSHGSLDGPARSRASTRPRRPREYRDRVLTTKGAALDEQGRATLAEDLRSPCTEEVAVFQAFSRVIHESRRKFVVVDTAPTGHTLLLLDATGSYHREIARQMGDNTHFTTPLMRLQNPERHQGHPRHPRRNHPGPRSRRPRKRDLERAGIHPWAWVVNNSLAAAHPTSPLLQRRAAAELPEIDKVRGHYADRIAVVPLLATEPVGIPELEALTQPRAAVTHT